MTPRRTPRLAVFAAALGGLFLLVPRARAAVCPGNTYTVNTASFTTIQAAVNGLPATLPANFCINVATDTASYGEQVTVEGENTNGFRLFIQLDPTISGIDPNERVNMNPPAASTAAFVVKNASVTLVGFDVEPTNAISYGVVASSPNVTLSSVDVNDNSGLISSGGAAVRISSWTTVSVSSINTIQGFGLWITGAYNTIALSTMTNNSGGATQRALKIDGSSNTVTQSFIASPAGSPLVIQGSNNTISLSTVTTNVISSWALVIYGTESSSNTVSQCYFSNSNPSGAGTGAMQAGAAYNSIDRSTFVFNGPGGPAFAVSASSNQITRSLFINSGGVALQLDPGGTNNLIGQSTMTSNSGTDPGLSLNGSSATAISSCFVKGSPAVNVWGSSGTVISSSTLVAAGLADDALYLSAGSYGLALSTSVIIGGTTGAGLRLDNGVGGPISLASVAFSGAGEGIRVMQLAPSAVLSLSTVAFVAPLPAGATAIGLSWGPGIHIATFAYVDFADANIAVNVDGSGLTVGSHITMRDASGPRRGPGFEYDPFDAVDWPGISLPLAAVAPPPANFAAINALAAINGTASANPLGVADIAQVTVVIKETTSVQYWDGTGWVGSPTPRPVTFVGLSSGTWTYPGATGDSIPTWGDGQNYDLYVKATDSLANVQSPLSTTTFSFDTTPPISTVTAPADASSSGVFAPILGTADDPGGTLVQVMVSISSGPSFGSCWTGAAWAGCPSWQVASLVANDWSYVTVPSGGDLVPGTVYHIQSRAIDLANNSETPGAPISFTYAMAQTRVWNGPPGGPASADSSWIPVGKPGNGDYVVFGPPGASNGCDWDLSVALSSLTVRPGYTGAIDFTGQLTVDGPFEALGNAGLNFAVQALNRHELRGPITLNSPSSMFVVAGTTVVAVGSFTVVSGELRLRGGALFRGTTVFAQAGSTVTVMPDFGYPPPILTSTSPVDWLSLALGGRVDISSGVFQSLEPRGLRIYPSADIVSLSSVTFFGPLQPGTTAINFISGGAWVSTFTNVSFNDNNIGANVNGSLLSGGRITMRAPKGPRAGPPFENDDFDYVDWPDAGGAGGIDEGFETGTIFSSPLPWDTNASYGWTATVSTRVSGAWSAQSGAIGHNQVSFLETSLNILAPGWLTFKFKTSSEPNDRLRLLVDNVLISTWAGVMSNWASFSYYVPATGQMMFRWEYSKSVDTVGGSDQVWLDDIQFPPFNLAGGSLPTFVYDDFNRAGPDIGNGWLKTDGQNLSIASSRLQFYYSSPNRGYISQQMDGGPAYEVQADLTPGSNAGYGCHYSHWLFRNFDGTISASDSPRAHALRVYRDNCSGTGSRVEMFDNGSQYAQIPSSFQFTGTLQVSATFYQDGSVRGSIFEVESGNPFKFEFSTRTAVAAGNKAGVGFSQMDSGAPWGTIDNAAIGGLGAFDNPFLGAGGAGIYPPFYFSQVSSTSFRADWTSSYPGGTQYEAQASTDPAFLDAVHSSSTYATSALFTGLAAYSTYFVRVSTFGTANGFWSDLGQVETLMAVSDGFESGDFAALPWVMGGNVPWGTAATAHTGSFAARSGYPIYDYQSSFLQLTLNVTAPGDIGFWRKVSSEYGWDFLKFYIDGVLQDQWSGELDWGLAAYAVTAGVHTFKWEYAKDGWTSMGQDAAFIDNISLPAFSLTSSEGMLLGNFSATEGAVYDGGTDDAGFAVAVDTTNYYIYSVGQSSRPGLGFAYSIVKYGPGGVAVASTSFSVGASVQTDGSDARPYAAAVDPRNGNLYVTGTYPAASGWSGWATVKFDPGLLFLASATFSNGGGGGDVAYGVAVDANGNVFVTGNVGPAFYKFKTIKYNQNLGTPVSQLFDAPDADEAATGVAVDRVSGEVYVSGYGTQSQTGVLVKYNNALVFQSSAAFALGPYSDNGLRRVRVAVDQAGSNIYVASDRHNGTNADYFTARFDPSLVWVSTAIFSRAGTDKAYAVAVATNGAVYVTGVSTGANADIVTVRYAPDLYQEDYSVFDTGKNDAAWGVAAWNGYAYAAGHFNNGSDEDMRTIRQRLNGTDGPTNTVYLALLSTAPATLDSTVSEQPIFRFGAWTNTGSVQLTGFGVELMGDIPASQVTVSLTSSTSSSFQPGQQNILNSTVFTPGTPPYAGFSLPSTPLLTTTTRYFFVTASFANAPVGSRLQFRLTPPNPPSAPFSPPTYSLSSLGLPFTSDEAKIQGRLWANPYTNPAFQYYATPSSWPYSSGGYYTGLYLNNGQNVRVESTGTWSYNGVTWHSSTGSNTSGGLIGGNTRGTLVGRIGSGAWFNVGQGATIPVAQSGDLYLAMSDNNYPGDNYSDNAGSITVRYFVVPSTVTKVWLGGYPGFETKADLNANWIGGKPANGDHVVFDASSYDCDWDIPHLSMRLLEMTTSYTRVLRLTGTGGTSNSLTVTDGATIARGTLDLGYGNMLTVPGTLLVTSSATLDLGRATILQAGSVQVTSNSFLTSYALTEGERPRLYNPPGTSFWQFRVTRATVTIPEFGPELFNLGTLDLGPYARINSFNRVLVSGTNANPSPSVRFHSNNPVTQSYGWWRFESVVSVNADGSDLAPGSNVTFTYSTGTRMGTPNEADPKGVINWSPDGGGSPGSIDGDMTGGSADWFYVWLTTDPAVSPTPGGVVNAAVQLGNSGSEHFSFTYLNAPATYYLFGWRGTSNPPQDSDARGGFGFTDGVWKSQPIFLPAGQNLINKDIQVSDWASAYGTVNLYTSQIGPVQVRAYWDDPTTANAVLQAKAEADPTTLSWSMALPPGTSYYFVAYVDVNGSAVPDYFEANGSSDLVNVGAGALYDVGPIDVTGGSAGLGGTVSIATETAHSGVIGVDQVSPMMKVILSAADLDATISGIKVLYEGDVPDFGVGLSVYRDDSGSFNEYSSDQLGYEYISDPAYADATIAFWSPVTIPAGQSITLFLTVDNSDTGSSRLVVQSSGSFAMSAGELADQNIYPLDTGWAQAQRTVPAYWNAYTDNSGGYWTGFYVYPGQHLDLSAFGVWYSSWDALGSGPGGVPGTAGQNTVLTSTNVGTLIARVDTWDPMSWGQGDARWFAVGVGTAGHVVQTGGELVLAMNDYVGAYYDNWGGVSVNYSASGSTTGAIAGEVLYGGPWTGKVDVVLNKMQWDQYTHQSSLLALTTYTFDLLPGTTHYPYLFAALPMDSFMVTAQASTNTVVWGRAGGDGISPVLGSTKTVDVFMAASSCTVNGILTYNGILHQGLFGIGVTTTSHIQGSNFIGWITTPAAGAYTFTDLPTPNTFYFVGFLDGNGNGDPDGPEPLGYYGSTTPRRGMSDFDQALTPVYVPVASSTVNGINIEFVDNGAISGNISLPADAQGQVVVTAVRNNVPENRNKDENWIMPPAPAAFPYSVGVLRPATGYAIFAFLDRNGNDQPDAGEESYFSGPVIQVPSGAQAYYNFSLQAATVPPAVAGFRGVGTADGVAFTWAPVTGASEYRLLTSTGGVRVLVAPTTSYYLDALAPNTSSYIRSIAVANLNGASTSAAISPVYTLAAKPASLVETAVFMTSVTLTWSANGNQGVPAYGIYRSLVTGCDNGVGLSSTTATSFTDAGLAPLTDYYYCVAAKNGDGERSSYSNEITTRTLPPTGPSIGGVLSYGGAQAGSMVVQAFGNSAFVGTASATVVMPNLAAQPYFLPVAGGQNYWLRAFVDSNGDQTRQTFETQGSSGVIGVPAGSPTLGHNFAVSVDTVAPAIPAGLRATPGLRKVTLSWAGVLLNADGSPIIDLKGYGVQRTTMTGASPVWLTLTTAPISTTTYVDAAPIDWVQNFYRVYALDLGGNGSLYSGSVAALPSQGGTISGAVDVRSAQAGQFRVRLSTMPQPNAPALYESVVTTFSFTNLADSSTGYFVRAFLDRNNDGSMDMLSEPSGAFGGLNSAYPIQVFNGGLVPGINVPLCDRTRIYVSSALAGSLTAGDCPALDKGPGYYADLYSFPVGDGSTGSLGLGSQIRVRMWPQGTAYDTELILLSPSGGVAARNNQPGGAVLSSTVSERGVYILEATSFNSGVPPGPYGISLDVFGGYSGVIAGTVAYTGAQSGMVKVQVFNSQDATASPIMVSDIAGFVSPASFQLTGLADGTYYVRVFRDANGNMVRDPGEPAGAFGASVSSPTAIRITGGVSSQPGGVTVTMTDPVAGAVKGAVLYEGALAGSIRVEAGQCRDNQAQCDPLRDLSLRAVASTGASGAYVLDFLPPATNYYINAYLDTNLNRAADVMEPFVSSGPVSVIASSTRTVSFLLRDPNSGAPGDGTLRGLADYGGAQAGQVWIGFSRSPNFTFFEYTLQKPATGTYERTGVVSGATYYMAAFLDVNGNGSPDFEQGEPTSPGAPEGFAGTPSFDSPPMIFVPLSGSATANVTLQDPPSGEIRGVISYSGSASPSAKLVVEAWMPGCHGPSCGRRRLIDRTGGGQSFPYVLEFLDAATNYYVNAFVDSNFSNNSDYGEPFGSYGPCMGQGVCGTPVSVSSGTDAYPTYGVDFMVQDPGGFGGGGATAGRIRGNVDYLGTQSGPITVRFFDDPDFQGLPLFTDTYSLPPGPGEVFYDRQFLPLGTYYLDAYRGEGPYNPTYHAYGRLNRGGPVILTSYWPQKWAEYGDITDPGAGGSVNVFSGDFTVPAGARFDGGASDLGAIVVATNSYIYVEGISKQFSGEQTLGVRYSPTGAMISSGTLLDGSSIDGMPAVDSSGRYYLGFADETYGQNWSSTGTITQYSPGLGFLQKATFPGHGSMRALSHWNGYLYAVAKTTTQPKALRFLKIDPATFVIVATATVSLPGIPENSFPTPQSMGFDAAGNSYFYAATDSDDALMKFKFLVKVTPALAVQVKDITNLPALPFWGVHLAVSAAGAVYLTASPKDPNASGQPYAALYKFDSGLNQQASATYAPIVKHFSGGMGNIGIDPVTGSVLMAWEAPVNGGDFAVLRYDSNLNFISSRTFDGFNNTLEDIPFSLSVQNINSVLVTGAVNNGKDLDFTTIKLDMAAAGAVSAAGQTVAITTANAVNAIWGRLAYNGTMVTSGTVRAVLLGPDPADPAREIPIRFSSMPFSSLPSQYLFNNLQWGNYRIQAFIDPNGNLVPDAGEPVAYTTATGVYFSSFTIPNLNLTFCDRRVITEGVEVSQSFTTADCPAPDRAGSYQRLYTFPGVRGQPVTLSMTGVGFYGTSLMLYGPDGRLLLTDDGSAGNGNSRITNFVLPVDGLYTVAAAPYMPGTTGAFKLMLQGSDATLGSISGKVDYLGSQGGQIVMAVFTSTDFDNSEPAAWQVLATTRLFTFAGLPTGTTYYLGAFLDVNQNLGPDPGEEGANYGGTEGNNWGPAPIYLQSGRNVYGADITIHPVFISSQAYVTGLITYGGTRFGNVRVELWPSADFQGQPTAVRDLPNGPSSYDAAVPGGVSYFIRAYMDLNGDFRPDADEPKGFYSPSGQGAEPLYAAPNAQLVNIDLVMSDPWDASGAGAAGEGRAAVAPSTVAAGAQMFFATITYTAGAAGIAVNGRVGFVVPQGFAWPEWTTVVPTVLSGAATISAIQKLGQSAFVTVTANGMAEGDQLQFVYGPAWVPCQSSTMTFSVVSAQNDLVTPQPLFQGTTNLAVAVLPGPPAFVQPANPYFSLLSGGLSSAQSLETRDMCGNKTPMEAPFTASLRARRYNPANYSFDLFDDTVGLSTAPNVALSTDAGVDFAAGKSSAPFYVMSVSTGFHNLEVFFDLNGPTTYYYGFNVLPANALTGVAVATYPTTSGGVNVTIVPNGSGSQDQAFFYFSLGDPNQDWHVLLSSVPFKEGVWPTPVWERWGWGRPALGAIAWDGRYSPWMNNGSRVPSGLYYVRVEVGGYGGVKDERLSVRVNVPQVAGRFYDLGNGSPPYAPLPGARVDIYGPNGSLYTQSAADGTYYLPGVAAGTYNFFVGREDFLDGSLSVTVTAAGVVSTFTALSPAVTGYINASSGLDVLMKRAPVLSVVPTISSTTFGVAFSSQTDQWGSVMVRSSATAAFQQTLFSPIRLPAGTTTFDDGGKWDIGLSTFVIRTTIKFNVEVGTYTVEGYFAGFDRSTGTVYVGADGARLVLSQFSRKGSISGTVTLPGGGNPDGRWVSVNAVSASSLTVLNGGGGGAYLPAGILTGQYRVSNLDAGSYLLRANVQGFSSVSSGPISVPVSSDVANINFPVFPAGRRIQGTATINADTTGRTLALYVNAWSPGSMNFGSTVVYRSGGGPGLSLAYELNGLDSGTTYQLYANLSGAEGLKLDVAEGLPLLVYTAAAVETRDFTFIQSSGVIIGTITLPSGQGDFGNVSMKGEVIASVRPSEVGHLFEVRSVTDPVDGLGDFTCVDTGLPPDPTGACPTTNIATFTVSNMNTETYDLTFFYRTTGQTHKMRLSVVNGSTTTVSLDLSGQTYSISGAITNNITNPLFNTNPKIVANAPFYKPAGWPTDSSSSSARVLAIRQDPERYNVAISTVFDPVNTRVGFLAQSGTFTISNVPSGIYYVRTTDLRACATCGIAVPSVGGIVRVSTNIVNHSLTLSDGFSVSGAISIDGGIRDARVWLLKVRNRRQEVVRSTMVYLGDAAAGLMANSVDYRFTNLPAGEFYTLTAEGLLYPIKYVGPPLQFPNAGLSASGLASNLTGQNLTMKQAAYIIGRLKDMNTGELVTANNVGLLAPSFAVSATANPWVEGGYVLAASSVSGRPLVYDAQGNLIVRVGPLLPEVSYDLRLAQTSWDTGAMLQGSQNYAPKVISGIKPGAGEVRDLGVIELSQGQSITGLVRATATWAALGGLKVAAKPSFGFVEMNVQSFTNGSGRYTLWVSTSVSNQFDVTVAPRDGNQASDGVRYGERTLRNVIVSTNPVDFVLQPLAGAVTGYVVVVDSVTGGELSYPFGDKRGYPAAAINLQPAGIVPLSNPLGDIEAITDATGRFDVPGLATGTYSLMATSLGYMVGKATVTVVAGGFRIYTGSDTPSNYLPGNTVVLTRGASVTGRILKSDGSAPNDTEVGGVAAANFAANEFVIGSVDVDPAAKTVQSYTISGFKTGISYDIIILPRDKGDSVNQPVEGTGISFTVAEATATKNINLTYLSAPLDCVPASKKALGNNQYQIKIECNKALRKKYASDDDLEILLTTATAAGQMLGAEKEIASNRRLLTCVYRAAAGEVNFSIRIRAYSQDVDPKTGGNFYLDKTFAFYAGLDSNATKKVSNIQGGSLELEPTADDELLGLSERAKVDLPPGAFQDDSGAVISSNTVELGLAKGRDQTQATALAVRALGYVPESVKVLSNLAAYPPEMAAAIGAYRTLANSTSTVGGANPLSSFYNIFLPAGIRHQLKQRADLTFSYSTALSSSAAADPSKINVYFYNAVLGQFVLEQTNRRLDEANKTITVSVDHFSAFVVLDGAPALVAPGTLNTSQIIAFNFPNPSDCVVHATILRDSNVGFGAGVNHDPFLGTMIRYSLPPGPAAQTTIRLYTVAGELVRKIDQGQVAGFTTNYYPWDCTNTGGRTVASGVYIGEVQWGNQRKFFKIAIIKGSGL
ncbi:MAG: right-handed parallel beta-helix repeat-containing protein [Elusimicrobia bacterium]|nr:right-handed parallel beta-helix repeat-containing protein [Elusimicrobiota bacterium]